MTNGTFRPVFLNNGPTSASVVFEILDVVHGYSVAVIATELTNPEARVLSYNLNSALGQAHAPEFVSVATGELSPVIDFVNQRGE